MLGVEAAANVARMAQDDGVPTWNRFFNEDCARDILAALGPAKVITAAGVFFHLEELHSVVRGIAALLAADGVFVVQAIYLGGMVENTAFDQIYHEHLCYYTLRSLSALLRTSRPGSVRGEPGADPWRHDRGTRRAQGDPRRRPIGPAPAGDRGRERPRRHRHLPAVRGERAGLRDRLRGLLMAYRAAGRSVWAYGAPAKGATLLNSFGIGPDLVQKAVEKNPLKIGLAIPGVRIPIEDEAGQRPDAYLVLAWNFIDEFVRKEQDWLADGRPVHRADSRGEGHRGEPASMSLPDAVVLFGASGFIGRNIVQALAGRVELLVGVNSSGRPVPGCTLTVAASAMDEIPPLPPRSAIVHVAAFRYFASRFAASAGGDRRGQSVAHRPGVSLRPAARHFRGAGREQFRGLSRRFAGAGRCGADRFESLAA